MVNEIGKYRGTTAFGLTSLSDETPAKLKVDADGPWTVRVAPLANAPIMSNTTTGRGDKVYLYGNKAADWTIANRGEANFVVEFYTDEEFDIPLLVNEIGDYRGTVPVTDGPAVVVIKSDGRWTIRAS